MTGSIDIVGNLSIPDEVCNGQTGGQTGLDEDFKSQVRMSDAIRNSVTIEDYLVKMDRSGLGPWGPAPDRPRRQSRALTGRVK